MDKDFVRSMSDRLQHERRALIDELSAREERLQELSGDLQPERQERAQAEIAGGINEAIEERQQDRLGNIDETVARIEAGTYGQCENCGRSIGEERLEANPTTTFCGECADREETDAAGQAASYWEEDTAKRGSLPPELALMDDEELQEHLRELVSEDGQVDMHELQIVARNGVVYLEGAVPSEPEHAILTNFLTDIAGVQEIVDHLEVQRLAWEREDRWKEEETQDVLPGTISRQEPYGGTEDNVLSEEEGVTYEPPDKSAGAAAPQGLSGLRSKRADSGGGQSSCTNNHSGQRTIGVRVLGTLCIAKFSRGAPGLRSVPAWHPRALSWKSASPGKSRRRTERGSQSPRRYTPLSGCPVPSNRPSEWRRGCPCR